MRFPPQFLDEVRSRIALSTIIGQHVRLKSQGREKGGLCPFHKEKTPSFTVNDHKGVYYCFGCGASGDVIKYLIEKSNMSFVEAVTFAAGKAGMALPRDTVGDGTTTSGYSIKAWRALMGQVAQWFTRQLQSPAGATARHYLEQRGFAPSLIQRFQVGYAPGGNALLKFLRQQNVSQEEALTLGLLAQNPETGDVYDRFRHRVIFPIKDAQGHIIAFGGRGLEAATKPKYLHSPETPLFHKSSTLFGLSQALPHIDREKPLLIVEGYTDVMRLVHYNFDAAVAPLGTACGMEQIALVWRYHPQPIVCFDGDKAGRHAAHRLAQAILPALKPGYTLRFLSLPEGQDPDTFLQEQGPSAFADMITLALPLSDYIWQELQHTYSISTPEGKAQFKQGILQLINNVTDQGLRQFYMQDFMQRFYGLFTRRRDKRDFKTSPASSWLPRLDNQLRQRYILFAVLINHPSIFHEVAEQLATLEFANSKLEELQAHLFMLFSDHPNLDTKDIKHYLYEGGFEDVLQTILSESTYTHAQFARPGAALEDVRQGWQEVWHLLAETNAVQEELKNLQQQLLTDLSPETWKRYQALKQLAC